jgi:hypothetical protein
LFLLEKEGNRKKRKRSFPWNPVLGFFKAKEVEIEGRPDSAPTG